MKYLLLLFYLFHFNTDWALKSNNGDPFDYIKSTISTIKSSEEFQNIINQNDIYIIVISYHNNYHKNGESDFIEMASIYEEIKRKFINNKKIAFYKVYMNSGIDNSIITEQSPGLIIYFNQKIVTSIGGTQSKKNIIKLISQILP